MNDIDSAKDICTNIIKVKHSTMKLNDKGNDMLIRNDIKTSNLNKYDKK